MKKLIALILIPFIIGSCSVISSSQGAYNLQQVNYYSLALTQNAFQLIEKTNLLINAGKEHKIDSVLIYSLQVNDLTVQSLQLKDSLSVYLGKMNGK